MLLHNLSASAPTARIQLPVSSLKLSAKPAGRPKVRPCTYVPVSTVFQADSDLLRRVFVPLLWCSRITGYRCKLWSRRTNEFEGGIWGVFYIMDCTTNGSRGFAP